MINGIQHFSFCSNTGIRPIDCMLMYIVSVNFWIKRLFSHPVEILFWDGQVWVTKLRNVLNRAICFDRNLTTKLIQKLGKIFYQNRNSQVEFMQNKNLKQSVPSPQYLLYFTLLVEGQFKFEIVHFWVSLLRTYRGEVVGNIFMINFCTGRMASN